MERLETRGKALEKQLEPLLSEFYPPFPTLPFLLFLTIPTLKISDENRQLEASLENANLEVKLSQEESASWRARIDQLLKKYDRIDPVEFQQLKDAKAELELNIIQNGQQAEELKKEIEELKQKITSIAEETQKKSAEEVAIVVLVIVTPRFLKDCSVL